MELVRKELVIEEEQPPGRVMARDPAGTILASGGTTSEVISRLQEVVCGALGEIIPWSAVVDFVPTGESG